MRRQRSERHGNMTKLRFCGPLALLAAVVAVIASLVCFRAIASRSVNPRRTSLTYVAKPLPSGKDAYTLKKYNEVGRQWMERATLSNYDRCGSRSPSWDDKAKKFLVKYAAFRFGSGEPERLSEAKQAGDELMDTGCTDPHLLYIYGNTLFQMGNPMRAEPFVRKGFALLEKSTYPRYYLYYGAKRLAVIDEQLGGHSKELATLSQKIMRYLGQAAVDEDFANGYQRYYAELMIGEWDTSSGMPADGEVMVQEIERLPNVDPWIRLLVNGFYHVGMAWRSRGPGWASEVTGEGWNGFGAELEQARKFLVEAYEMHPEYPEAAARMITVSMGSCGDLDARLWFDRAVAAQFDYSFAYNKLMWAMRPRWGGSHEEMYRFGIECLNTKRFDTAVPKVFHKMLTDIGSELEDWRDVYRRPGVYEQVQSYYEGALAEISNRSRSNALTTSFAVSSWAAGRYEEAEKHFDKLGGGAEASAFADFGVEPAIVLGETRLRCSPHHDKFEQAEELYANGQSLEAVPLFEALRSEESSDSNALFVVSDRLASLKLKSEFQKGGWVNIMPGPDFLGWEKKRGCWFVEVDGTLKGRVKDGDSGQLLLLKCQVGPDYEIKGEIETRYRAGVAFGYAKQLTPSFASFKIDKFKNLVCLGERFAQNSSEIQHAETLEPRNRFHVRVSKGRVTAYVNDKLVFDDQPIDKDLWAPDNGRIGVGSSCTRIQGSDFRFRDLQLRKFERTGN